MSNLRQLRMMRGMSQVDLAVQANVGVLTVHVAEKGKLPSPRVRRRLCDALGCPEATIWPQLAEMQGKGVVK